ncbi:MAG: hypothetical protein ACI87E_001345 [Mariniblastus sp.]|jgi:uncharacterized protein (TIGR02246 family)
MRNPFVSLLVLFALALSSGQFAFPAQQKEDQDTASFEKRITGYVEAFNRADAKALANFWSEQGDFITSSSERWKGRTAIADGFANWFAVVKDARLELLDPQVEIQSPSVAIETGIARVTIPNQEPTETGYRAILVNTSEGWKIDGVSEYELESIAPSNYERLQELEWMVGNWSRDSGDSENSTVEASCRWTTNQNFLLQTYRVTPNEGGILEISQVIGWDPDAETIRSWTFDSDGGFSAGRWSGGEGRWTCQSLSVLPDGKRGSATNIYERVDKNKLRYSSIGRQVDGELIPNVEPVEMARVIESPRN